MLAIAPEKTTKTLIDFIKTSLAKADFERAVVALSGGVDSATSCALAVRALGAENVFPLLLPYGLLNTQGVLDAMVVVEQLAIPLKNVVRIDIKPVVDAVIAKDFGIDNVRRGNLMARTRMMFIFDQAKKRQALVVGTENKSEHLLGYFTRFGDAASDIEPLHHLYKTQVYQLAKYLNVPVQIIAKAPTAGLWDGQTDEGDFGFTYAQADIILHLLYDDKKSIEDVTRVGQSLQPPEVFDRTTVEKVQARVAANAFKHHLPLTPQH